jgi:plasmid stability protein
MPVDLAIKDAPDHVVDRLKLRARSNRRSLEGEVLAILEEAVGVQPARQLTIQELLEEVERSGLRTPAESAAIIRADRDGAKHGR